LFQERFQGLNLDTVSGTVSEGDFKTRFEARFQAAFPELVSKRDFQLPCFTLNIGIEGTVNSSVVG